MTYRRAIEAAGATVHDGLTSGDWQGRIYFHVTDSTGTVGIAEVWYGSCGSCDRLAAWLDDFPREDYDAGLRPTPEEWADFGRSYLGDNLLSIEEVLARVREEEEWDLDATEVRQWLEQLEAK